MEQITYDEFKKLEARIGTVIAAEAVPDADKLIRCQIDFGVKKITETNDSGETVVHEVKDVRQILSGIREWYTPEELVGRQLLYVVNLAPRTIRGFESNGMLMAVDGPDGAPVFLVPDREVEKGAKVR